MQIHVLLDLSHLPQAIEYVSWKAVPSLPASVQILQVRLLLRRLYERAASASAQSLQAYCGGPWYPASPPGIWHLQPCCLAERLA